MSDGGIGGARRAVGSSGDPRVQREARDAAPATASQIAAAVERAVLLAGGDPGAWAINISNICQCPDKCGIRRVDISVAQVDGDAHCKVLLPAGLGSVWLEVTINSAVQGVIAGKGKDNVVETVSRPGPLQ